MKSAIRKDNEITKHGQWNEKLSKLSRIASAPRKEITVRGSTSMIFFLPLHKMRIKIRDQEFIEVMFSFNQTVKTTTNQTREKASSKTSLRS